MEYAQYTAYLRAIRERIWFPALTGGLALLIVIGMRISPLTERSYTAHGRLLVLPIASRVINSSGKELAIGSPVVDTGFWATLVSWSTGPDMLERVTGKLKLEAGAIDRYAIKLAGERIAIGRANSDVLELRCTSNNKDVSLHVAEGLLKEVCATWKTWKIGEARRVVEALKQQLPSAEADIEQAQAGVKAIEARHGGVAPDREAEAIQSSLVATQLALQNADLEATAGQARSQRLMSFRPRPAQGQTALNDLAFYERIDTLKEQIMVRQAQLADMMTRRTRDHPVVKQLQQQIAALKKRTQDLETAATITNEMPDYVREANIEASAYASEMATRRTILAQREQTLRDRLSTAHTEAIKYQEANTTAQENLRRLMGLKENISSAASELQMRQGSEMITIQAPAEADPQPSTAGRFALRLLLGGFVGVGLGLGVIILVQYFDTSFRNETDAARLLGCPIVAGIPRSDMRIAEQPATPLEPPPEEPVPEPSP